MPRRPRVDGLVPALRVRLGAVTWIHQGGIAHERLAYPLIDLGLDRARCLAIITAAGLPEPPKSACWSCPFHTLQVWQDMRIQQPSLFWRACELEIILNERRQKLGRDPIWLTAANRPLEKATTDYVQGKLTQAVGEMCGVGTAISERAEGLHDDVVDTPAIVQILATCS